MGKSYTYKYQVGRSYRIKEIIYDVVLSSTDKNNAFQRARKYDYTKVKKDLNSYAVLVPVAPSMTLSNDEFRLALKKILLHIHWVDFLLRFIWYWAKPYSTHKITTQRTISVA